MLADRYELEREIGRGGMGAVWLAHDTVLDRAVAIKQIGVVAGSGAPDLDRAEREAHLAARVNHQNVVAVYDFVHDDRGRWLVMEHVDGPTLAALIAERGAVPADEMAPVLAQVAGALAAAHEHRIVHRDVKPSNILLTSDGVAKLSDFGVARAQADASLTQTGLVTGSPAYLSPEVATGRTATPASDVWSLGATMFHALSGHPPYAAGDNVLGAMYRIVHEEPPRLSGTGRLDALVTAMMQQDPDARPTMTEVQHAVDLGGTQAMTAVTAVTAATAVADPTPTSAYRPLADPVDAVPRDAVPRDGRHRAWLAALAAAAVAAVLLLVTTVGGDSPDAAEPSADSVASPVAEVESDTGAAALEGFATDYLTAASNDPDTGFTMLTPKYQQASGGIEGYKGFWSKVSDLDVVAVEGDPKKNTVAYTYSYDYEGERRTEDVVLQLTQQGNSFLIDGDS